MKHDPYAETRIILEDMPVSVRGFCYHDDDGNAFVVLNSRLSTNQQRKTYRHEIKHIKDGDMYNENYKEYGQ